MWTGSCEYKVLIARERVPIWLLNSTNYSTGWLDLGFYQFSLSLSDKVGNRGAGRRRLQGVKFKPQVDPLALLDCHKPIGKVDKRDL